MQIKKHHWPYYTAILCCILLGSFLITLMFKCSIGVPVLNYHQVNSEENDMLSVPVEEFEAQMAYLEESGYTTITPDQLRDFLTDGTPLPEKPVLITFDDGYKDNYTNAFPILKKHHMTATIFLVTDYIGRFEQWMDWPDVQEMSEYGIVMGSHTLSHEELAGMSSEEAHRQLADSKSVVEWRTLKWVEYIAYPCGAFTEDTLKEATAAGYKGGFTVNYDYVYPGDSPFSLSRIPVFGGHTHQLTRFKLRLMLAPLVGAMERTKVSLEKDGYTTLAKLIITP